MVCMKKGNVVILRDAEGGNVQWTFPRFKSCRIDFFYAWKSVVLCAFSGFCFFGEKIIPPKRSPLGEFLKKSIRQAGQQRGKSDQDPCRMTGLPFPKSSTITGKSIHRRTRSRTLLGKIHRKCPGRTKGAADENNDTVTALGGMCRRYQRCSRQNKSGKWGREKERPGQVPHLPLTGMKVMTGR